MRRLAHPRAGRWNVHRFAAGMFCLGGGRGGRGDATRPRKQDRPPLVHEEWAVDTSRASSPCGGVIRQERLSTVNRLARYASACWTAWSQLGK